LLEARLQCDPLPACVHRSFDGFFGGERGTAGPRQREEIRKTSRRAAMKARRASARLAAFVAMFRVFTAVTLFQLSGGAHVACDVFEYLRFGDHLVEAEEQENDPSHDCPPGCPTCHHVHYSWASLPPALLPPVSWLPLGNGHLVAGLAAYETPSKRLPVSVFRPPRT
jgi:hypothetical protein